MYFKLIFIILAPNSRYTLSIFLTLKKEEYFIKEDIRQKYQSESVKDPPGGEFSILHLNLTFRVSDRNDVCISVYMSKFALVVSTTFVFVALIFFILKMLHSL